MFMEFKNMNKLKNMAKNAKKMNGQHEIKLNDLMSHEFISKYSKFENIEQLFKSSGFEIHAIVNPSSIPNIKFDEFISNNTSFESWEEMHKEASIQYYKKKVFQ